MQIRKIAVALLSLNALAFTTSCGGGGSDVPSNPDRVGEKAGTSSKWAKYSYMRVDPKAPEGTCNRLNFALGSDGSWQEEKCGEMRSGAVGLEDVKPITAQIEEIIRNPLIRRCFEETVWRGEYYGDLLLPDGKERRLIAISSAGNCFLGESRSALRLGNSVEKVWRKTLPPGEPVICAPNQPVCPGADE